MLSQSSRETVQSMTAAGRARTVLAAGNWLSWQVGDEQFVAPYFDHEGLPVLLLGREQRELALEIGHASTMIEHLPALGVALLFGRLHPVTDEVRLSAARHHREQHAGCDPSCRALGSEPVGVMIDQLRITSTDDRVFARVDLEDYRAATPDLIMAGGVGVAEHLNADHQEDLVQLTASLVGIPPGRVLASKINWIDATGVDLSLIDFDGATSLRAQFVRPLRTLGDLGTELHRMLREPGQRLRVEHRDR